MIDQRTYYLHGRDLVNITIAVVNIIDLQGVQVFGQFQGLVIMIPLRKDSRNHHEQERTLRTGLEKWGLAGGTGWYLHIFNSAQDYYLGRNMLQQSPHQNRERISTYLA